MADFCRFSPKSTHLARCKRQIWCFLTCGKPRKTIHEPRFSPWGREVVFAGIRGKPGRPTNGRPIVVMRPSSTALAFVGCHFSDERRQSSHLEAQGVVLWRHSLGVLAFSRSHALGLGVCVFVECHFSAFRLKAPSFFHLDSMPRDTRAALDYFSI